MYNSLMSNVISQRTLKLSVSKNSLALRALLSFLAILALTVLALEAVGYSGLGSYLPAPTIDLNNFLFSKKIYDLEAQIRRDGRLDCLFIGSSAAYRDIDPAIVEQVYKEATGETIHCYNMGIPVMTLDNTVAVSRALVRRYHPKVVICTVLVRDIDPYEFNADYLESNEWVQYNDGRRSFKGWLLNHSYTYKYYLTWRQMLVLQNRVKMISETLIVTAKGFESVPGIRKPYTYQPRSTVEQLTEIWSDPGHMESVLSIGELRINDAQVIVLEGPEYMEPDTAGAQDPFRKAYEAVFVPGMQTATATINVQFWRTNEITILMPKTHWFDWRHLNAEGALTFSEWLGAQLAQNSWLFK